MTLNIEQELRLECLKLVADVPPSLRVAEAKKLYHFVLNGKKKAKMGETD